ncbi:unnamed protein product [Spodoptera littoralis]|uniref:BPTI/Kunitz inhibitor domain-containing protein n=1 Tax=Spodoptera littoralis TaxID=7109 RepID=A0A9P0IEE9_SPOLI|nr:unnamed protein product [Spodoptera littoralis]CAH1645594.1 unnamed protein product [Spodoptera littoralis]
MGNRIFEIKNLYVFIVFVASASCEGVSSIEDDSGDIYSTTLTTAKEYGSVSPKPRNLYRRFNVAVGEFGTPLDLFRGKKPQRRTRSHIETIWKWDFWCQLQPKIGKCTAKEQAKLGPARQSFYYDAQLDACQSFVFSGCDGNKNNFATLVDCERHCKGSAFMAIKESTRTTYCGLQSNAGLCMALIQRYYYDINEKDCKVFLYGGCGGNQNRFKTHSSCMERCTEEK